MTITRVWCFALVAMATVSGSLMVGSPSTLAASRHTSHGVARVARLYDSCDAEQSDTSNLNSTFAVSVRGFPASPLSLLAPHGWACDIEDGNGSGAGVEIFSPTAKTDSYGERNGIDVSISANVGDGIGAGICPYSSYKHRNLVYPCDATNSKRPAGVSVEYFAGNSSSSGVVVMVTTPASVAPPAYAPGPGHVPTVSVLAVMGSQFDAWMTCRIGDVLTSTCLRDARAFAHAVETSSPFS